MHYTRAVFSVGLRYLAIANSIEPTSIKKFFRVRLYLNPTRVKPAEYCRLQQNIASYHKHYFRVPYLFVILSISLLNRSIFKEFKNRPICQFLILYYCTYPQRNSQHYLAIKNCNAKERYIIFLRTVRDTDFSKEFKASSYGYSFEQCASNLDSNHK